MEQDLQSLSFDDSSRLVDDLTNRVFDLVNSSETVEKLGGLTLLQQLLTMRAEQHDTILLRCMNVFRILFQQATLNAENRVIDLAARVLGFLCHTGAALTHRRGQLPHSTGTRVAVHAVHCLAALGCSILLLVHRTLRSHRPPPSRRRVHPP